LMLAVQIREHAQRRRFSKALFLRSTILLLLVGVACLATFAKVGQYYPRTTSAHYVSIANKMDVAHPPLLPVQEPLRTVTRIMPPQPVSRDARLEEPEIPFLRRIGVVISLQHRSPPFLTA